MSLSKCILEELIPRIMKLDTFIQGGKPRTPDEDGFLSFGTDAPGRDGACIQVNDMTMKYILISWQESGHNGDPYDTKRKTLSHDEALKHLKEVEAALFRQAQAQVVENTRVEEERQKQAALKAATELAVFGDNSYDD